MVCECCSSCLVHSRRFPTFGFPNLQSLDEGERRFLSSLNEGLIDYGQYYKVAAATVLFYDILLTMGDEVNHIVGVALRYIYCPWERSNIFGMGKNHQVRRWYRWHRGVR